MMASNIANSLTKDTYTNQRWIEYRQSINSKGLVGDFLQSINEFFGHTNYRARHLELNVSDFHTLSVTDFDKLPVKVCEPKLEDLKDRVIFYGKRNEVKETSDPVK